MHYLIVFKSKLRPDIDQAAYEKRGEEMYKIVTGMPGMISSADYTNDTGENVSIVEFDTLEHLIAWRDQPDHLKVQQEGRDKFFASYSITVAKVERSSEYDAATKTWTKRP